MLLPSELAAAKVRSKVSARLASGSAFVVRVVSMEAVSTTRTSLLMPGSGTEINHDLLA